MPPARTGDPGLVPNPHHFRRQTSGDSLTISVTDAGWRYLDFSVYELQDGDELDIGHSGREVAVVPVVGTLEARAGGKAFQLDRKDVFSDPPHVLYVPPGEISRSPPKVRRRSRLAARRPKAGTRSG